MYIEPNTIIKLYHNVPLDMTQDRQLYFGSRAEQNAYFHARQDILKYSFLRQSYQRVDKGIMRVAINSELIYDCNYLAFQNTNFGSKWFYAYITGIEYINNETCEITYEIDVIQTYLLDVSIAQCFVEREHSITDEIGDNIVPESLDTGEYVANSISHIFEDTDYVVLMVLTPTVETYDDKTGMYDKNFGSVSFQVYDIYNQTTGSVYLNLLKSEIRERLYNNKINEIVSISMVPRLLFTSSELSDTQVRQDHNSPTLQITGSDYDVYKYITKAGTYNPHNNKLYTAPYRYLHIENNNGNSADFEYEYFTGHSATFNVECCLTANPQFALIPLNYKGSYLSYKDRLEFTVTNLCPWFNDAYLSYLASNKNAMINSVQNSVLSALLGGINSIGTPTYTPPQIDTSTGLQLSKTGSYAPNINGKGLVNNAFSLYKDVSSLMAKLKDAQTQPNQSKGAYNSSLNIKTGFEGYTQYAMSISGEFAERIDKYFDMFGYATKTVKVPNYSSRPHWNYVKTMGCDLNGSVPADEMARICEIFNKGITFWKNPDEVGDYSLDNRPTN